MKRGRGGVAVTAEWSVSYLRHSSSQGLVLQQTYYKGMLTGSTLAAASGCLAAVKSRWEGIVLSHQSKHWTDSAKLWLRFSASEGDCIRRSLRTSSWYDGSNALLARAVVRYAFDMWRQTTPLGNHKYRRVCLVSWWLQIVLPAPRLRYLQCRTILFVSRVIKALFFNFCSLKPVSNSFVFFLGLFLLL